MILIFACVDCRFNFLEFYAAKLGANALPREWYLIPPDVRLTDWPGDLRSYPTSHDLNPDVSWLGASYHQQTADALDVLYRRVLAIYAGNYPASNVLTPPPTPLPCSFVGPCQNSSTYISVRTTVEFTGVNQVSANLFVYSEHNCDDMRLSLHVVVVGSAMDNSASPVSA